MPAGRQNSDVTQTKKKARTLKAMDTVINTDENQNFVRAKKIKVYFKFP